MYKKLRGEYIKVPWRRMTCNNQGNPKWIFALYLAIQRRLYTRDRLEKWGSQVKVSNGWNEELTWAVEHASNKTIQAEVYRMTLAATIYYIWQERNMELITRAIIQDIHCRANMLPRFICFMQKLNFDP
ncbi:hypothetical protein H5410_062751 [Solanum commersonii]|uniref:Reverse transcriptase zinc-binding domain-containing protein n=1 Tax=Solanum commersonii TaxID=4109 RepID=A0A9J5WBI1_SOLCO|nr:hypothetical protein H5410_062751 [Solanum commersonii]